MVGRIYHIGLTVSDLDRSIAFYRDILGLKLQGEIFMEGEETDKMFRKENCKQRVIYLNGSKALETPPIELIQFADMKIHKAQSDLFTTSISEVCFYTDDIDSVYKTIIENHVDCLSEPQYFDFRADGFGKVRLFILDPDGIILEMMRRTLMKKIISTGKWKLQFVKVHYGQIFKRNKNVRLFQRKHTAVNSGKKMEKYK